MAINSGGIFFSGLTVHIFYDLPLSDLYKIIIHVTDKELILQQQLQESPNI